MALVKKPVTGMKDIQPAEMQIRDYVIGLIKETYKGFGFTPIETPCVENIANLSNKQGGENEKLIFKILKRGEKLNLETAQTEADLVDSGLRYDLTVPLSRYYSNNAANLPKPFKALQIGPVWRADRPQKGRFRQFYQCDIDILGDPTNLAEIELILATTTLLGKVGFKGFTVHINDRRILKGMAKYSGFDEAQYDEVFIILDKMDKIGLDGVCAELSEKEFSAEAVENFREFLSRDSITLDYIGELLTEEDAEPVESLKNIIAMCNELSDNSFNIEFDLSLVRGQGYYTGTVFEVESIDFKGAIAGGGRYDNLIGKFLGQQVSAVGFSIGFERIFSILMEHGIDLPNKGNKIAVMYDEGELTAAYKLAEKYRAEGKICSLYVKPKKMGKFLGKLEERGYAGFINVSNDDGISYFEN